MDSVRLFMIVVLVAIWGGVGWILTHLRKVKRQLQEDEAMPKEVPARNILLYLVVLLVVVSALLLYLIF